jgi:hypothetical protein
VRDRQRGRLLDGSSRNGCADGRLARSSVAAKARPQPDRQPVRSDVRIAAGEAEHSFITEEANVVSVEHELV